MLPSSNLQYLFKDVTHLYCVTPSLSDYCEAVSAIRFDFTYGRLTICYFVVLIKLPLHGYHFLNGWIYKYGYDAILVFYCLHPLFEGLAKKLNGRFLPLVGEDSSRCRLCASSATYQLHLVIYGDFATFNHKTVERKLAVEAPVDAASDFLVLGQRIGIV